MDMEWVLQEAFQDQRHSFLLNTIGIHHLSAEGPVQLWSFFMRRSTSVIGCMHQDQAAPLPSRLDQTIMVCFWVTDDIYSPEMHLYHSWQLGWHLHDKKKDNISMMSVQHNYAVNKKNKYSTNGLKGAVIFPELQKLSVFMQWEHFAAPCSSHITPKASEPNDRSTLILIECLRKG